MINALSVDLEDWFCVSNFNSIIPRHSWDHCEMRVENNTRMLLDLFDTYKVKATFFVLGWVAERIPELILELEQRGHEIGVHGYYHLQLTKINKDEFQEDLKRAIDTVRNTGIRQAILGFRAPSFSIVKDTYWAFEVLEKLNLRYDSSIFPVRFHPDYGIPDAPLRPYQATDAILEFPMSCAVLFGMRIPCCGGAYFRLYPYAITKSLIRKCNGEGAPVVFYLHPWELDPGQPRIKLPPLMNLRHYYGLAQTKRKLELLLNDFEFTTIRKVLDV